MKFLFNIDQKKALRAGVDAPTSTKTIDIPAANIPANVRDIIADLYQPETGRVSYGYDSPAPELPLTEETAIAALVVFAAKVEAERAKKVADDRSRLARLKESTEQVLRERRTKSVVEYTEGLKWMRLVADWPYDADKTVTDSPEAKQWAEDIRQANADRLESVRAEHAAKVRAAEERRSQERDIVLQCGTTSQVERLQAGRLSVHEIDTIVSRELFAPFIAAGFNLVPKEILCDERGESVPLDEQGWSDLKELKDLGAIVTETRQYGNVFGFVVEASRGAVSRSAEFTKRLGDLPAGEDEEDADL